MVNLYKTLSLSTVGAFLLGAQALASVVVYDEAVDGDLPASLSASEPQPTLAFGLGVNSIFGQSSLHCYTNAAACTSLSDFDSFSFEIPEGAYLSSGSIEASLHNLATGITLFRAVYAFHAVDLSPFGRPLGHLAVDLGPTASDVYLPLVSVTGQVGMLGPGKYFVNHGYNVDGPTTRTAAPIGGHSFRFTFELAAGLPPTTPHAIVLEPSTHALVGAALLCIAAIRRRRSTVPAA